MATAANKRKKQQGMEGEGFEPVANEEVDAAADDFVAKRDERMRAGQAEAAAKAKLIQLCIDHKIERYRYEDTNGDPREIIVKNETDVKVRKVKQPKVALVTTGTDTEPGDD